MAYTTIDDPGLFFNTVTWTGNDNESRDITGVGFQPDWVWGRRRDDAAGHNLLDVVRGAGQDSELQSNGTGIEGAGAQDRFGYLSAFLSDGFRVQGGSEASGNKAYWNQNSATYVAWNWKAGGTASSNTDGSITSSVSTSTTSGFSIVSYTGTGSALTCGHGLGAVPQWIIVKDRDGAYNWNTYHVGVGNAKTVQLNLTNAESATSSWNSTTPTSSVFSLGAVQAVNTSSNDYIAYCFAEKKGYSRFSKYTGNGSTDGPFIYCGFKPAWVMMKRFDSTNDWFIYDNTRNPFNETNLRISANQSSAESTQTSNQIDMLSNGFKCRGSAAATNTSGGTYIYMAFAESPFVNSNGVPNNAR